MSRIVFPPRDLPGRAEVWGRAVEGELGITHEDVVQLRQVVTNGLRATSGQLETIAQTVVELSETVTELQSRSSSSSQVGSVTLTYGTGFGQKGPATVTTTMPPPVGGTRSATLTGSGTFAWAGGAPGTAVALYTRLEVRFRGNIVWSGSGHVSPQPQVPASFDGESFTILAAIQVPQGTPPEFEIRLYGYRSASGSNASDAIRAENITLNLTYGDKN